MEPISYLFGRCELFSFLQVLTSTSAWELYESELEALKLEEAHNPSLFSNRDISSIKTVVNADRDGWEPYREELWSAGAGPSTAPRQQPIAGPSETHLQPLNSTYKASTRRSNAQRSSEWAPAWALDHLFGSPSCADPQNQPQKGSPITKDCIVCAEDKSWARFPENSPTTRCKHDPNTCLDCIEKHIKTELEDKIFHEKIVRCPECSEPLDTSEVQKHADPGTFEL
jgi:hypothetical protein